MNERGTWLMDGQSLTKDGEIVGTPMRSETASFWLNGAAARFRTWRSLVLKYLQAEDLGRGLKRDPRTFCDGVTGIKRRVIQDDFKPRSGSKELS